MNDGRVLPKSEGKFRTSDVRQSYSMPQSSMLASMSLPSDLPLQDERDSLMREKLELHSQLFEAAQIQRKLSGPQEFPRGCLQFASEVFAARFLPGDFTSFLQSGSKVLVAH